MSPFARTACAGLFAALIGCGGSGLPKTVQLGGAVTLDGKAISNVMVTFASAEKDGVAPVVAHVTNGRYSLPVVPVGKYRVTFRPSDYEGGEVAGPVGSDAGSKTAARPKSPLPDKYREQPQMIEVMADKLDLNFDLSTK